MSSLAFCEVALKSGKTTFNRLKLTKDIKWALIYRKFVTECPLDALHKKVDSKEFLKDEYQEKGMIELNKLYNTLGSYSPTFRAGSVSNKGGLTKFFGGKKDYNIVETDAPQGVYLYGGVGGGKTTIMNMFYDCCTHISQKQRLHYTSFMTKVHSKIHQAKLEHDSHIGTESGIPFDPTLPVANSIAKESWLLCLDEIQVTDIADAMILKRLFIHLFNNGIVLVATSNRAPDDLYKHGLQRSQFLPFIPILKSRCHVIAIDGGVDYRTLANKGTGESYYFVKSKGNVDEEMDRLFKIMCTQENDTIRPKTITHFGRNLTFAKTCGQVLDTTFDEMCDRPLSGNDYVQIAQYFHTVFLRNIPRLTSLLASQTRRFVTLVDALYDNKIRLIISSDVPLTQLFAVEPIREMSDDSRTLMDDLDIEQGSTSSADNVFSNAEEIFALERTRSRLNEMQTQIYWERVGRHK